MNKETRSAIILHSPVEFPRQQKTASTSIRASQKKIYESERASWLPRVGDPEVIKKLAEKIKTDKDNPADDEQDYRAKYLAEKRLNWKPAVGPLSE